MTASNEKEFVGNDCWGPFQGNLFTTLIIISPLSYGWVIRTFVNIIGSHKFYLFAWFLSVKLLLSWIMLTSDLMLNNNQSISNIYQSQAIKACLFELDALQCLAKVRMGIIRIYHLCNILPAWWKYTKKNVHLIIY